jgi:hypothetical protein
MAGGGRVLEPGGRLFLYGPYLEAEIETSASNLAFDASLKSRDPDWGLRHVADVRAEAAVNGLRFAERVAMPANNIVLVFEKN